MSLSFFEKMEQIDAAIRYSSDVEQMMSDVLQVTLDMFQVDRAWLLFPCDPGAASWKVPMERTRAEYPGALAIGKDVPMNVHDREVFRNALEHNKVITINFSHPEKKGKTAEQFYMLSQMHSAIYPRTGNAWLFGVHQCSDYREWTKDEEHLFRWIGSRLADALGNLLFYRVLQERDHFVRDLLDATAEAILGFNLDEDCTFANATSAKLLGYEDASHLIGRKLQDTIFHSPSNESSNQLIKNQYSTSLQAGKISHSTDLSLWRADGNHFPVEYRSHPIYRGGELSGAVITFFDITDRKRGEELLLYQAHFDSLTGLPNRFLSLDRLSQLITEAKRKKTLVTVLFLDLDDFKKINDTLGHEAGDKLLIEAGRRFCSTLREGDTIGRLGGDEFIILLGGLKTADEARPIVDNLLNCFKLPFRINGRELILTASIGISIYPNNGETASMLLQNADSAMYHAKDSGRNTYSYFTTKMNLEVSRRLEIEEHMQGALERGEFQVYYQLQTNINSDEVIGAEALLRWFNPVLGNISPVEFIPIAEQTGSIIQLGQFVFEEALSQTAQWQQNINPALGISVNLSPRQFRDPKLSLFLIEAVKKSNVSATCITLEITEGVLLGGHRYIKETLNELTKLGLNIAIDDFGVGYSSLSYLREYPFDELKIDRSFVNNININSSDYALIDAAISMAHALSLQVVAEGVETEEQYQCLKKLGCDIAQGYLIGKPLPPNEIVSLIKKIEKNTHR